MSTLSLNIDAKREEFELESPRTIKQNEEKTIKSIYSLIFIMILDLTASVTVAWWFYYINLKRSQFKQCVQISSDFLIYKANDSNCIGSEYSYDSGVVSNIIVYYFTLIMAPVIIILSVLMKENTEIYKNNKLPNLSLLDDKLIIMSYIVRIMTLNNYFNFYDLEEVQVTVVSTQQGVGVKWGGSMAISLILIFIVITKEMTPVLNKITNNRIWLLKIILIIVTTVFVYGALIYIMNFNTLNREPWSLILPKGAQFIEITYLNYGIIVITFIEFMLSISIYNMTKGKSFRDKVSSIFCPLRCCKAYYSKCCQDCDSDQ